MPRVKRPQDRYRWNAAAARYVDTLTGRFVPQREVAKAVDTALRNAERRAVATTNRMRAGRLDIGAWQDAMRSHVRDVHLYTAAAAKGGWAQLDRSDKARVAGILRHEYTYLDRWARQLEAGTAPVDGRAISRTRMYTNAARGTLHRVERSDKRDAGYQLERNVLHPAEHCSGCEGEAGRGWVRIGTLIPVGRRQCGGNCHCTIEYSTA